jgi:outer membrane protein assembly factor BamB
MAPMKKNRFLLIFLLAGLSILITACTALPVASYPGVSAVKETVYISYGGSVLAIDPSNGSQKWRYPTSMDIGRQFFAPPVVANGTVLVGSQNNVLYALDAASGVEKWSFSGARGKWNGSPLILGSKIYAPNGDGTLYTLSLDGGAPGWKFPAKAGVWATPLTDGKLLYVLSLDRNLYAIQIETGEVSWQKEIGSSSMYGPIMTPDGIIYLSTLDSQVVAVNTKTRDFAWQTPFKAKGSLWGSPLLSGENLFVADEAGKFYSINAKTGVGLGEWDINPGIVAGGVAFSKGLVFVTTAGDVVGVTEKGEKFLNQRINGKLYSPPIVSGEYLLVGVYQGEKVLIAYDTTGKEVWSVAAPK